MNKKVQHEFPKEKTCLRKEYAKRSRWVLGKKCNVKRQIEFFMNLHEKKLNEIKVMRFYWPSGAAFRECFAVGINFEHSDIRNAHVYGVPWEWVSASDFINKE